MIARYRKEDAPKGFLINMDLAKLVGSRSPSGAPNRTGTMEFMAIEVLRGAAPHSWRHDLESFFYVLIWVCVIYGDKQRKTEIPYVLGQWSSRGAASFKYAQMSSDDEYLALLKHFKGNFSRLTPLINEMRLILFPSVWGGIQISTPQDHRPVYDALVNVLDKYIAREP
jgi:hypothetical protein